MTKKIYGDHNAACHQVTIYGDNELSKDRNTVSGTIAINPPENISTIIGRIIRDPFELELIADDNKFTIPKHWLRLEFKDNDNKVLGEIIWKPTP